MAVKLEATGVQYRSSSDEAAFFEWLDHIAAVQSYDGGYGNTEVIVISPDAIDEQTLQEFVALYRRYHVDPAELQVFKEGKLGEWFAAPERFWHKEVFNSPPIAPDDDQISVENNQLESTEYIWSIEPAVGTHTGTWQTEAKPTQLAKPVILQASDIVYYSPLDERAFFEWLDKSPIVDSYEARQQALKISVNVDIDEKWDLAEFPALYDRYNIDMRQLRALNAGPFASWFSSAERWWYAAVFG